MSTICLNMIVKDEAHIIEKTLANLCSQINFAYWVIVDTGSSDTTKEIITEFFKNKNIPGELHETAWQDFAFNRTDALNKAYNKTDYLLVFDADDSISGKLVLPDKLVCDRYNLIFGDVYTYTRPLLVSNRKKSKFTGVLHEFFHFLDNTNETSDTIKGSYHIVSGRTGARSKDPQKYHKDALVLEKAYNTLDKTKEDEGLKFRYAFYCAQSYKDCNMDDKAIEWYLKRVDGGGWNQEIYISYCTIGQLYAKKNEIEKALYYYMLSYEVDPERLEGLYEVVKYYREKGKYNLAYKYYMMRTDKIVNLNEKLFVDNSIYDYLFDFEFSIISAYIGKQIESMHIYKKLFSCYFIDTNIARTILNNFVFFYNFMNPLDIEFYNIFMNFTTNLYKRTNILSTKQYEVINNVINVYRPIFSAYPKKLIKTLPINSNDNSIIFTITTCKRFDLFEQTMNSFINNCVDIHKITKFLCIDDNSSEEDQRKMKSLYPFMEFYFKKDTEKGHRTSMNIIWDRLNHDRPTFWLHMEDDWLFIKKDNYITKATSQLDNNDNIMQVLFNKNYGEIISCYDSVGGTVSEDREYRMHIHNESNLTGRNCAYWPHYSFRPSIIRTSAILELGNYDSSNTFFERDYANKYNDMGYKSMFFNMITCLHIGKCTWESNTDKMNAYALNNTMQFATTQFATTQFATTTQFDEEGKDYNIKIVNLKRRPDRKENTLNLLSQYNINKYEFIEAHDGKELKDDDIRLKIFEGNDFKSNKGMMGCALSHIELWTKLIMSNMEYYIIMEDDINVSPLYNNMINELDNVTKDLNNIDIIFLGHHMWKEHKNDLKSENHINKLILDYYVGGTFAYLITKSGAMKILEYITKNGVKHGIDYIIKITPNLNMSVIQPHLITSDWVSENGSMVDSDIYNEFVECDWDFYAGMDSYGNDINFYKNKSISDIKNMVSRNNKYVAFNSLGFVKSKVNFPLTKCNYLSPLDGIYIKKNKMVTVGRLGDYDTFDITYVHDAIKEILNHDNNIYFILENTKKFYEHQRIVYIDKITDDTKKEKFIKLCDVMLCGSFMGNHNGFMGNHINDNFEFDKKVIINKSHYDNTTLEELGNNAIVYDSKDTLIDIFTNIRKIIVCK